MTRVLIFWDIYGRLWRKWFIQEYPKLRAKYAPDFSIVNIENITSGRGPVKEHAELIGSIDGIDLMTSGDHIYDNSPNIDEYFKKDDAILIRPANFRQSQHYNLPGQWYKIIEKNGVRILVIELLGEAFMHHKVENPYLYLEDFFENMDKDSYDICIVEFHRETTAELYGMAHMFQGKIGLVYGTHTHIQTNDAHILPEGTALISDVWMNGPSYSVIWADFNSVKKRFLTGISRGKIEQQLKWDVVVNAICIDFDAQTWYATNIENISYRTGL